MPKERKPTRLKNFDYSSNGAYFVTICSKDRKCILSHIPVGQGLAPAENRLTEYGKITENQLLALENRFKSIEINKYVIMPNHIHCIIIINNDTAGASPCPTLSDIICAFNSITTRFCNQTSHIGSVFQSSFYDHIIRDENDYIKIWRYIDNNPIKWELDKYYTT